MAWLGAPDHQGLSPLKEEQPSEADKRPQSWVSRNSSGAPGCLPLDVPINMAIVIFPLQAPGYMGSLSRLQPLPSISPCTIKSFSGVPPSFLGFDFPDSQAWEPHLPWSWNLAGWEWQRG